MTEKQTKFLLMCAVFYVLSLSRFRLRSNCALTRITYNFNQLEFLAVYKTAHVSNLNISPPPKTQQTSAKLFDHAATINDEHLHSEPLRWHRLNNEHELARLLFAHLRHQMQRAVDDNVAIQPDVTAYINDRLATMELHVGLPRDVVDTTAYVNGYFADFLWRKMNFIDHLESRWAFAKRKMEDQMVPTNRSDRIVAALYPTIGEDGAAAGADGGPHKLVQYSIDLHAIVVAERAVNRPYFHHKYPM